MALISSTPDQIKAEKQKEYEKLKKYSQNKDVVQYPLRIPTHIHTKLKTKLSRERKNIKEVLIEMIVQYIKDEK